MNTITFEYFPIDENTPKDQHLLLWDTEALMWIEGYWSLGSPEGDCWQDAP